MSVSLCMIVKNEEEMLGTCLESVKDIVDEMIIVDTGSEDATEEIAKSFGAKIFYYQWNNSFADARNYSLSKATGDWILIMDADDEFAKEDIPKLKEIIENPDSADIYYMKTVCFTGNTPDLGGAILNMNVRLIRNGLGCHFMGDIHEHPVAGKSNRPVLTADICFYHYGYMNQTVTSKDKRTRNRMLIEKEIEKEPDNPIMLFYLANEYFAERNFEKAYEIFHKSLAVCSPYSSLISKLYFRLILCSQFLGNAEEAISYADKVLAYFPNFTDAQLLKASILLKQNKTSQAIRAYNKCIRMGDPPPMLSNILGAGSFQPHLTLSELYFHMNFYDKAYYHCNQAMKLGSLNHSSFILMKNILTKRGYSSAYIARKLMQYAIPGGYGALMIASDLYYDCKEYDKAIKLLNKAEKFISKDQDAEQISYYKGKCYFYCREFAKAKACFRKITIQPQDQKAAYFIALCDYLKTSKINAFTMGRMKAEYHTVLANYKKLLEGKKCKPLEQDEQSSQSEVQAVFSFLDILLTMERFNEFQIALGLLKLIKCDKLPFMLAKLYFSHQQYEAAYTELLKVFARQETMDIPALDMMKQLILRLSLKQPQSESKLP